MLMNDGSVPCEAFRFAVLVQRGPTWDFGDQDGGLPSIGQTQVPSRSVLKEWLIGGLTGSVGGTYSRVTGMYSGGWWFDRSHWAVWPGNTEGGYYKAGDCGEYDLVDISGGGFKEEQQALLGVIRHRVLEVIGDLQEETVMGVFTINGLSKRTIMKRLRKVKAYSEHRLWLAYGHLQDQWPF